MVTNQKWRPYIFAFLVFCVLSSKHIIIYNEEVLVALTFGGFIYFVTQYFGETIRESLDERSHTIEGELKNFFLFKKESLLQLCQEHQKLTQLKQAFSFLDKMTQSHIERKSHGARERLSVLLSQQLKSRFGALTSSSPSLQAEWQEKTAFSQLPYLLYSLNEKGEAGERGWDPKRVKKAIDLLRQGKERGE